MKRYDMKERDREIEIEGEREREREKGRWIDNEIGDEGAKSISESLKINTSLTTLDLGGDEKKWNEIETTEWKEMINE